VIALCLVVAACTGTGAGPSDAASAPDAEVDATPDAAWPTGEVIVSGLTSPLALAVDDTSIYWIDLGTFPNYADGRVMRANKDGTNQTPLAQNQLRLAGLAIDGPDVFWTAWGSTDALDPTGFLATVPKAGGTPITLSSGFTGPSDIAVSGSDVYFLTGEVCRIPRTGGDCEFIAWYPGPLPGSEVYSMNGPAGLVTDGAKLLWSNSNDGDIVSVDIPAGGEPFTVASGQMYAFNLALDQDHVYWTTSGDDRPLARAPKTGGTAENLTTGPLAGWLAVNEGTVYFSAGDGTIRRVASEGGLATVLARGEDMNSHPIAVDDQWVYWTSLGGTIARTPKGG